MCAVCKSTELCPEMSRSSGASFTGVDWSAEPQPFTEQRYLWVNQAQLSFEHEFQSVARRINRSIWYDPGRFGR